MGCILAYLGIRGFGYTEDNNLGKKLDYNATALLGYWDIFKNYYANKQEEDAYYMGINKQFTDGSWTSATSQTAIKQFNPLRDQNGAYPFMTNTKRSEILLYNNFNRVLTDEEIGNIKISSADGL